jgi:hypothetical protein
MPRKKEPCDHVAYEDDQGLALSKTWWLIQHMIGVGKFKIQPHKHISDGFTAWARGCQNDTDKSTTRRGAMYKEAAIC